MGMTVILRSTLRAPLRFFDTMALGRLLNRFGKDFEQIDAQLPDHLGKTLVRHLNAPACEPCSLLFLL